MVQASPFPSLGARQREILRAVIREYIASAQPVASAALVRRYRLEVSPATVRNELAALEELGLLTHPHTSAGRVPTDLGYRYFIESLMPEATLRPEEQLTVSHQFQQARRDTAEWLRLAASILARLTAEASIVTPPTARLAALRHAEAVPINERRVLLVAVLDGGAVRQQLVELSAAATTDELRTTSAALSDRLGSADAAHIRAHAARSTGLEAELARALAGLVEEHDAAGAHDVYYDGIQNIFAQPEFGESGRARELLGVLEDRTRVVALVPRGLGRGEVSVAIGGEHRHERLQHCSLVFGRYGGRAGVVGYIGVVGPTRMDYARTIGAVRYVGGLMSDLVRVVEGG
jgi:heat-inducible transcriptional repressor